jgi:hypothetical protein
VRRAVLGLLVAACRFAPEPTGGDEVDAIAAPDTAAPIADGVVVIDAEIVSDAASLDGPPPSPDASTTTACGSELAPDGYELALAGRPSCYRVDADPEWWIDAQADCVDDGTGTHLVVLDDLAENAFIHRIKSPGQNVWIGVSDRVDEGVYRWVTAQGTTILPLPWHTGKGTNGSEDCVELRDADALWNDHDCFDAFNASYKRRYVCEYDGVAAEPTNY